MSNWQNYMTALDMNKGLVLNKRRALFKSIRTQYSDAYMRPCIIVSKSYIDDDQSTVKFVTEIIWHIFAVGWGRLFHQGSKRNHKTLYQQVAN